MATNNRGTREPNTHKAWWEMAGLRIGVISGALGLALTVMNWRSGRSQETFQQHADAKVLIETEAARAERARQLPRIEASYLALSPEVYAMLRARTADKSTLAHDDLFLSYPIAANALITKRFEYKVENLLAGQDDEPSEGSVVAFLLLQNLGGTNASSVELSGIQLTMRNRLKVVEQANNPSYSDQLIAAALDKAQWRLELPRELAPTEGVLVPLFTCDGFNMESVGTTRWTTSSRVVFLPDSLTFIDPVEGTKHAIAVRRMKAPLLLSNGVAARG